jgi:uncharacterized membrane protein
VPTVLFEVGVAVPIMIAVVRMTVIVTMIVIWVSVSATGIWIPVLTIYAITAAIRGRSFDFTPCQSQQEQGGH